MRILARRGRQSGKTYELLTLAAANGGTIVVADVQRALVLERMAEQRGLTIRQPVVANQVQAHHWRGTNDQTRLYVDDVDVVLSALLGYREIDTVTWNGPR